MSAIDINVATIRLAGAIILLVIYGYDVAPKDDHYVQLVESTRPAFALGTSPKWLVNNFPVLRYIPSWFPGAGFKKYASATNCKIIESREETYKYAMTAPVRLKILLPVIFTVDCFLGRLHRKAHLHPLCVVCRTATPRRRTCLS